jgi:ribosomal protein S5
MRFDLSSVEAVIRASGRTTHPAGPVVCGDRSGMVGLAVTSCTIHSA